MYLADNVTIFVIWGDEAGHCYEPGIGKEFGHFTYATDIFFAIFRRKAKVLVQTMAHIVTVKDIGESVSLNQCVMGDVATIPLFWTEWGQTLISALYEGGTLVL